jgi:hypothetical protein
VLEKLNFSRNYGEVSLLLNCPVAFKPTLEINKTREYKLAILCSSERNFSSRIGLEVWKLAK